MKRKNVTRAAKALFMSQGDDKNSILGDRIQDKEVREIVKDQGRALVVIEKLLLPQGVDSYTQEEMEAIIFRKLEKKGHRIQEDDAEDTPEYAEEKRRAKEARQRMVPNFFGKTLDDLEREEAAKKEKEASEGKKDEFVDATHVNLGDPTASPKSQEKLDKISDWFETEKIRKIIREELAKLNSQEPEFFPKKISLFSFGLRKR